jgi:hypothetical protein
VALGVVCLFELGGFVGGIVSAAVGEGLMGGDGVVGPVGDEG